MKIKDNPTINIEFDAAGFDLQNKPKKIDLDGFQLRKIAESISKDGKKRLMLFGTNDTQISIISRESILFYIKRKLSMQMGCTWQFIKNINIPEELTVGAKDEDSWPI